MTTVCLGFNSFEPPHFFCSGSARLGGGRGRRRSHGDEIHEGRKIPGGQASRRSRRRGRDSRARRRVRRQACGCISGGAQRPKRSRQPPLHQPPPGGVSHPYPRTLALPRKSQKTLSDSRTNAPGGPKYRVTEYGRVCIITEGKEKWSRIYAQKGSVVGRTESGFGRERIFFWISDSVLGVSNKSTLKPEFGSKFFILPRHLQDHRTFRICDGGDTQGRPVKTYPLQNSHMALINYKQK